MQMVATISLVGPADASLLLKLLVLGASGRTGQLIVEQAIERGHAVHAVVRKLPDEAPTGGDLRYVQGNVLDQESIGQLLPDHDAVLSALGARAGQTTIYSQPGVNLVRAMKEQGRPARLVFITSAGMVHDDPAFGFVYRNVLRPLLLTKLYDDQRRLEAMLRENLWVDWTLVRPTGLTDGPLTRTYRVSAHHSPPGKHPKISRADLAHFMLEELEKRQYIHATPTLAY